MLIWFNISKSKFIEAINMKWIELNRETMNMYKGIAILMIVIHNFMHWLPGPKEMEFNFEENYFLNYIQSIIEQPERLFQFSMSFLGHFGVQIFIFLSAYGLTKKYLLEVPNYKKFIIKRFSSIYPPFLLAIIFWAVITTDYQFGLLAPLKLIYWKVESLFYKITLLSNFIPKERLSLVGPWWFISLIFQFYIVFPLMFKLQTRWGNQGIALLTLCSFIIMSTTGGVINNVNLGFTVLGHIPELCLGMYLATNDPKTINIPFFMIAVAFITFILGNVFEQLWNFTHVSFLLVLLSIYNWITPYLAKSKYVNRFLIFIGTISMHLFLVNGFLRRPFIEYAIEGNNWESALMFSFISLTVSILVAFTLFKCEELYRKYIFLLKLIHPNNKTEV